MPKNSPIVAMSVEAQMVEVTFELLIGKEVRVPKVAPKVLAGT